MAATTPAVRSDPSGAASACVAIRFAACGKAAIKQPLDHQHEADRDDEIGHLSLDNRRRREWHTAQAITSSCVRPNAAGELNGYGLGAEALGALPDGSTKKRKNSESGLSSMRVSLFFNPAS